jgi:hypothetical protein
MHIDTIIAKTYHLDASDTNNQHRFLQAASVASAKLQVKVTPTKHDRFMVAVQHGPLAWTRTKTYSDFKQLHVSVADVQQASMSARGPQALLVPKLPQDRTMLNSFLDQILLHPLTANLPALLTFLGVGALLLLISLLKHQVSHLPLGYVFIFILGMADEDGHRGDTILLGDLDAHVRSGDILLGHTHHRLAQVPPPLPSRLLTATCAFQFKGATQIDWQVL